MSGGNVLPEDDVLGGKVRVVKVDCLMLRINDTDDIDAGFQVFGSFLGDIASRDPCHISRRSIRVCCYP